MASYVSGWRKGVVNQCLEFVSAAMQLCERSRSSDLANRLRFPGVGGFMMTDHQLHFDYRGGNGGVSAGFFSCSAWLGPNLSVCGRFLDSMGRWEIMIVCMPTEPSGLNSFINDSIPAYNTIFP